VVGTGWRSVSLLDVGGMLRMWTWSSMPRLTKAFFMVEHVLFQDRDVVVTTSRVRVGGTTYALRNITSVRVARTDSAWGARVAMTLVLFLAWIIVNMAGGICSRFWERYVSFDHLRGRCLWRLVGLEPDACLDHVSLLACYIR